MGQPTVIPLHSQDDTWMNRGIALDFTVKFDQVLDPEHLRRSLDRLLEIGDWRKLGARLRLNASGQLEYHMPDRYDAQYPGFTYSTTTHSGYLNTSSDACAPALPRKPKIRYPTIFQPAASNLDAILHRPDSPTKLEDWIYTDRPQLNIHIATFADATLVTLTWLHTLMDASGRASLLKAWSAIVCGREHTVPPFHGFSDDPLADVTAKPPLEWFIRLPWLLIAIQWLFPVLTWIRALCELVRYPAYETRLVCVPGAMVTGMREQAMQELAAGDTSAAAAAANPPFVSESDIIVAWWSHCILRCGRPSCDQPITILNNFNIRAVFPGRFPPSAAYIGNAWLMAYTNLRCGQVLGQPVSHLALKIRKSLLDQRSKEQIYDYAYVQREGIRSAKGGFLSSMGLADSVIHCSNWHQARFFDVDFSAAVVGSGGDDDSRRDPAFGRPSLIIPTVHCRWPSMMNLGSVIGKDAGGDWWLMWQLKKGVWREMETQLAGMR
ncbi:hypothetical protein BO71DRAFT_479018 [Aspergillus ellipticus CBS 707.79]|uniref:LysR family regulatory protein n=1 Tax=Aspergillus ellipticus CBS 707.79 TaxID=1448320 RepID=A0A319DRR8_9EURO|nr:hypothetical protein BO71DRAFT_479018 [Aspergillus ellipticus CBS 707.79]